MKIILRIASVIVAACVVIPLLADDAQKITLTITGGHETDQRDHGRPVVLIGYALGVTPEIFREAFSRVTPAPGGTEPAPEQVRKNKSALLGALSKQGVTNERLDEVSNYYRYQPGRGRLWPTSEAEAVATFKNGKIEAVSIIKPGSGYSSLPKITAPGHPEITITPTLAYGKDLKSNGSLSALKVAP
jgi:hypothetical protein